MLLKLKLNKSWIIRAFSMTSSGRNKTSPFSAIWNMLMFCKTLESWRRPGYPVVRSKSDLYIYAAFLLTAKIISFTVVFWSLNSNMRTIDCAFSWRNFTDTIILKLVDWLGSLFSGGWESDEIYDASFSQKA